MWCATHNSGTISNARARRATALLWLLAAGGAGGVLRGMEVLDNLQHGGWFASQRLHLNPYLVFALCVPSIGLMSWFSYQWLERGLYRRMQAWLAAPRGQAPAYVLSRVKY